VVSFNFTLSPEHMPLQATEFTSGWGEGGNFAISGDGGGNQMFRVVEVGGENASTRETQIEPRP
jgi:hypothetical protein